MLNLGHLCVCVFFPLFLCYLAKILNSSAVMCTVDLTQAKFPFASKSPPKVKKREFMHHFT